MRVGIVTSWFERGAAYVSKIFKAVLEKENDVFIYARGGEEYAIGDKNWDGPHVYWGKKRISPFSSTVINKKDFYAWVKKNKIELVLFNEQHWWQPILWCKEFGLRTVAYIDYYTEETIPFFELYDALICNTKRHYSAFSWHKSAIYLPWGTNINLFKPKNQNLVNNDFVTFFHSCGWDIRRKGTDILIKAFKNSRGNGKLIIHSQNEISDPELKPIINQLEKEGRLDLIIKTTHAPGLYHLGDIYLYPTRLEGIGLTVPEALACGLGVVVPDNGPMNEFATNETAKLIPIERFSARADGYYWPKCECNLTALTEIINTLSDNPENVKSMKNNARIYAEKNLDVSQNFKELPALFKELSFKKPNEGLVNKVNAFEKRGIKIFHSTYLKYYPLFNAIRKTIK